MLTIKEKVQAIRKELKSIGIIAKQVTVKGKDVLYDESIKITIKDLNVNIKTIENIANKYKKIDRGIATGEILQGCNTYISVSLDYSSVIEARKEFIDKASELFEKGKEVGEGSNITVMDDDRLTIVYSPVFFNGNPPHLKILERPEDYKTKSCYCYEDIKRFNVNCIESIAEALTMFKYQYGLNL